MTTAKDVDDDVTIPRAQHEALMAAANALQPFAELGQWFFARDVPDETPVAEFEGLNNYKIILTRGHFKVAHSAFRAAGIEIEG